MTREGAAVRRSARPKLDLTSESGPNNNARTAGTCSWKMGNWDDRVFVACISCNRVYVARQTKAGTNEVQVTNCSRCGNTVFEPIRPTS